MTQSKNEGASWESNQTTPDTVSTSNGIFPLAHRYSLLAKLGEGGMGDVWKAEDHSLKRIVALKVSKKNPNPARFLREARILAELSHPNIISIYDIGKTLDANDYYTMKLVQGNSLRGVLSNARTMDTKERLRAFLPLFLTVCRALESAHGRGIVHRDLKPENIMLEGDKDALVCDWGLAKKLSELSEEGIVAKVGEKENCSTQTGQCIGTLLYASPEQLQGNLSEIDQRSDVYSLGVILYEILFGIRPYLGKTNREILSQIQAVKSNQPENKEIPQELQAIALKAIQYKKENRYASVRALGEDLENFLSYRPISALRESPFRRLRKWLWRHPIYSLSMLFMLILIVLLPYGIYTHSQWKFETKYNQWMEIWLTAKRRAEAGVQD